ncbi:MAG: hypothetical protein ACFE9S_04245 [Candidatus Hermodarchaeota archaeon]
MKTKVTTPKIPLATAFDMSILEIFLYLLIVLFFIFYFFSINGSEMYITIEVIAIVSLIIAGTVRYLIFHDKTG